MPTTPLLLFLLNHDPRTSPRPAEAIRIAAGLAAWQKVRLRVCLRGPAVWVLTRETHLLLDDEPIRRHLPGLADPERPFYVQASASILAELGPARFPCQPITPPDLAALAARADCVLQF